MSKDRRVVQYCGLFSFSIRYALFDIHPLVRGSSVENRGNNEQMNRTINYKSYDDLTIQNLPFKADGSINNINGVGTINGTRSPRTLQLVLRFTF
ncbi:MAG: hypothetical protein EHM23_27125 [Acidobacteria bacterium]|nr:MAG: hypothetical protein EHM23_27125 [Acidobacteriota bacterium]